MFAQEHMTVRIDSSRCGQEFAGILFVALDDGPCRLSS
jgi:hypothetical protein